MGNDTIQVVWFIYSNLVRVRYWLPSGPSSNDDYLGQFKKKL